MKYIPLLFSAAMSIALQKGSKTQTRRVMNPQPVIDDQSGYTFIKNHKHQLDIHTWKEDAIKFGPYGLPGDIIWSRETFTACTHNKHKYYVFKDGAQLWHDGKYFPGLKTYKKTAFDHIKWTPGIHMPKVACRKFLQIEAIEIQKLHEITDDDAVAEGILYNDELLMYNYLLKMYCNISPVDSYKTLWQSINGEHSWDENPWVYKISFKDIPRPANFLLK